MPSSSRWRNVGPTLSASTFMAASTAAMSAPGHRLSSLASPISTRPLPCSDAISARGLAPLALNSSVPLSGPTPRGAPVPRGGASASSVASTVALPVNSMLPGRLSRASLAWNRPPGPSPVTCFTSIFPGASSMSSDARPSPSAGVSARRGVSSLMVPSKPSSTAVSNGSSGQGLCCPDSRDSTVPVMASR